MNGIQDEARLILHAIWQRRWLALAVAWALALVGWLVISLVPNGYASESRISVQMRSLLPGKVGVTAIERQQEIDRVRQTLTSTVNLEKIVRETDIAREATSPGAMAAQIEQLREDISIKAQQDNLVQITAKSARRGLSDRDNAKLAHAINQKLVDIFVAENLVGNRDETAQTLRFLDQQLTQREKDLESAERKRAAFEQRHMGLLPGAGSAVERVERTRLELDNLDQNLMSAQSALVAVQSQIASAGAGGYASGNSRAAQLESQIADAQSRGWTETHPDMIALQKQLAIARSAAAREPAGAGAMSNPAYGPLRAMQAERQATVAALRARKAALQAELSSFTAKTAEEPGIAAEQARLNRDYDVLKQQYDKLLQDREEIKLRSDVENQTDAITFRVIDPPSVPRSPVAPNRPLLLVGVLFVALCGGIGSAFALSQLRGTFATASALQRASGMSVLGAISAIDRPGDQFERRQKLKMFKAATVGLFGCFALLMVVELFQRGSVG